MASRAVSCLEQQDGDLHGLVLRVARDGCPIVDSELIEPDEDVHRADGIERLEPGDTRPSIGRSPAQPDHPGRWRQCHRSNESGHDPGVLAPSGDRYRPAHERGRVPHRTRLHGRGPGAGHGQVRRPDATGRRELPDLGPARSTVASSGRWPRSRGRPPRSTPGLDDVPGVDDRDRRGHRGGGARGRRRSVGRSVPGRRVPDRLGHLVEHEHATRCWPRWPPSASARSGPCIPTITSTTRSRPTTSSRPPCTWPRPRPSAIDLLPALVELRDALRAKADEFAAVVKSGRTHLMDATPVTLGQEFGGYAAQIDQAVERLDGCMPDGWPRCRWAARRSAPASTLRPPSPPPSSSASAG